MYYPFKSTSGVVNLLSHTSERSEGANVPLTNVQVIVKKKKYLCQSIFNQPIIIWTMKLVWFPETNYVNVPLIKK